jgi:hypothetical protein
MTAAAGLCGRAGRKAEEPRPNGAPGLSLIVLHLARSREFPDGSARHGYEIIAPLDANGPLDGEAWKAVRDQCRVRRFWAGEPDREAILAHRAGGAEGATWLIDYDGSSEFDDEAGYRLGSHVLADREYVSIKDPDGHLHTFRVTNVEPI